MSVAIRIDDELYRQAETTAKAESRTPPLQIQYWPKLVKPLSKTLICLSNLLNPSWLHMANHPNRLNFAVHEGSTKRRIQTRL